MSVTASGQVLELVCNMKEHDGAKPCAQDDIPVMPMSVEDIIEGSIGQMNFTQLVQTILASIPPFFDSIQTFMSVFADAEPDWHCTNLKNCHSSSDICRLSRSDWAWNGNVHSSTISEWDLECASSFIRGLPATSFFIGCLVSGFVLPSLGDSSLGRRNLVFFSCLIMSLAALASAFSPNIWVYSAFRFISGVGRVSILNSSLVLLSERVGKRWRAPAMLTGLLSLYLGTLSLSGIAYLARNSSWRTLYLWTSVPALVCCTSSHFFVNESPRWLFMRGRNKDAIAVLKTLGSVDHISLAALSKIQINEDEISKNGNPFSSLKILLKRRWAVFRLLACMVLRFGIGLVFYGVFFGVGGLGLNIYLMTALNSVGTLMCSFLTFLFWVPKCNRRSTLLGLCAVSGIASITSIAAGHHHKAIVIVLEFVSLFSCCIVLDLSFVYAVEMFPTCVRNSATAMTRQAFLLASVIVPVVVLMGRKNQLFSHTFFGLGMLLSGLVTLFLPETRGKPLCDTMEEQETRDMNGGCIFKI